MCHISGGVGCCVGGGGGWCCVGVACAMFFF